jgi:hypothetical protein
MLGWPAVERVWLPSWLGDPDAVLDRLVAAVDAVDVTTTAPAAAPAPPAPAVLPPAAPEARPVRRPTPYRRSADGTPLAPATHQLAVVPAAPVPVGAPGTSGRHAAPLASGLSTGTSSSAVAQARVEVADAVPASPPRLTLVPAPVEPEPDPEPVPEPVAETAPKAPRKTSAKPSAGPAAPLDGELPLVVWTPKPAGEKKALDQLADPKTARAVRRVLVAGVRTEGPVHRDRLVRAAAAAFGLSRVSETRREALLGLLPAGSVVGEFVWPAGQDPATWTGFRRQAAAGDRPLAQVAPEEVGNAMAALCRATGGLPRAELYVRTLEVFGTRRQAPALLPHLEAGLAAAVAAGRLTEQPDGLVTA